MGKFWRRCCRRETYAVIIGMIFVLFQLLSLAFPWFAFAATHLPNPWDSMTAAFYWGGFEGAYSPPLTGNQRTYNLPWGSMISTMPKDVYMSSMAMGFLALFSMMLLIALIFCGFIWHITSRTIQIMFFGYFKWVVVLLCFANLILSLISWTVFFAFPDALYNANMCPGATAYTPPPFPYVNGTQYFDQMFCLSIANSRYAFDGGYWVWAPSLGWIFGIICTVFSLCVLWIMLSVPSSQDGTDYERIKD